MPILLLPILLLLGACASNHIRPELLTSLDDMTKDLARRDVVFLGEVHQNPECHRLQLATVQRLHAVRPNLVLTMEMVERDVQEVLDRWLRKQIEDDDFVKQARASSFWKGYASILRFARDHGIKVVGANVPRPLAARVAKEGAAALATERFMPQHTTAPRDAYWHSFVASMNEVHPMPEDKLFLYYQAQCVKDDAMAESIAAVVGDERKAGRAPMVVHLCGDMHSKNGLGTVARLRQRLPDVSVGIVSTCAVDAIVGKGGTRADYLWLVPRVDKGQATSRPASKPAGHGVKSAPVPEAGSDARPGMGFMPGYGGEVEGCPVENVFPDRPAALAGLQSGDVIVAIDGEKVDSVETYALVLDEKKVGQKVKVAVMRKGARKEFVVTLGETHR